MARAHARSLRRAWAHARRAGVTMDWTETLRDCVGRLSREAATQPAIVGAGSPLTYADLHARALSLAAGFRGLGLGPGDIVAVQLPNSVEFVTCYLASGYIGATLQTIHMPYRGAEVETLLAHSRAGAAVCLSQGKDASPAEIILSRQPKLPHLKHIIAVGPQAPAGTIAFASLAGATADEDGVAAGQRDGPFRAALHLGHDRGAERRAGRLRAASSSTHRAALPSLRSIAHRSCSRPRPTRISTACSRSTSHSPPAPRPRSCRRSRRRRLPPRSMPAARPGCSSRRRICRRA